MNQENKNIALFSFVFHNIPEQRLRGELRPRGFQALDSELCPYLADLHYGFKHRPEKLSRDFFMLRTELRRPENVRVISRDKAGFIRRALRHPFPLAENFHGLLRRRKKFK